MNLLLKIPDFIMNIDKYMGIIVQNYGIYAYILLFMVIFCETGLVVLPFLPGDSLVFAAGAFAAMSKLNIFIIYIILLLAAFLGDSVNYSIGKRIGSKVENLEKHKLIKKDYIEKTEKFFQKHGGKAIVLARFMPIIRTFAPFVAGTGKMKYSRFIKYNILGSFLWVTLFTFAGYFFGNISFIKEKFSTIILLIIFISLLPIVITYIINRIKKHKSNIQMG